MKALKLKIKYFLNKYKELRFEAFKHKIDIQISKITEPERILWLGNKLLNEIEGQGNIIKLNQFNMTTLQLDVHHSTDNNLSINNILTKFAVKGKRDLTI